MPHYRRERNRETVQKLKRENKFLCTDRLTPFLDSTSRARMATSCILGKRKSRSKNDEFLLDPEYTRSHEPVKRRGKRLFRSIAALFGFGKKKEEVERIEFQKLGKEEMPYQWMEPIGFEAKEKSGEAMGFLDQGMKKRPRLGELLGWNLRFVEKEGFETEIRE